MSFTIRPAVPSDAGVLASLILELAAYEKLTHEAIPDPAVLGLHLAQDASPRIEALIAEDNEANPIAFALFFPNYSTFLTRWGIYLEDLYVRPAYRGQGIGFALLKRVAEIAVERECGRMEWAVLDWNEPAIQFYRRLGAKPMDDWTTMRLTGEALADLGKKG
jgi:GNAT superfamily N-acetyltransferase